MDLMLFTKVIHRRKPGFLNLSLLFNLAILPFGGLLLYGVARESGPKTATVVVHVTISDVVVRVGDHEFPIEEYTGEPIVCELPRGEHRLTMTQGDVILHEEVFHLDGGEDQILTAWPSLCRD